MDDFADVARARNSYQTFSGALAAGREILKRAGVPEPPPIPDFDAVYQRLDDAARQELYAQLRLTEPVSAQDAIRIWTPLIKQALSRNSH